MWLVNKEARGLELPSYSDAYVTTADHTEIRALVAGELGAWDEIDGGREQPFDGILLRDGSAHSFSFHIGLVTEPGRMLHVERGRTSAIERYASGTWRHRVLGRYRFRAP